MSNRFYILIISGLSLCVLCALLLTKHSDSDSSNGGILEKESDTFTDPSLNTNSISGSITVKSPVVIEGQGSSSELSEPIPAISSLESGLVFARMPVGLDVDRLTTLNRAKNNFMADAEISSAIDEITGAVKASNRERFQAVGKLRQFSELLSPEHTSRLLNYLANSDRYQGMSNEETYSLVNNLLAIFHDSPQLDEQYLNVAITVINNTGDKEVIRDYNLQGLSRAMQNASADQATRIREVFWANVDRTGSSLAGTAIYALNREYKSGALNENEIDTLKLRTEQYVESDSTDERTLISAVLVASDLLQVDLIPRLQIIAQSTESSRAERIAAQASITALHASIGVTTAKIAQAQ